jgi:hypothetical protein
MLTDEYELLHPVLKMAFQGHQAKHADAVAQQMLAMAAVQGAGAGQAGPGGSGSPDAKPLGKPSQPRQNPAKSPTP